MLGNTKQSYLSCAVSELPYKLKFPLILPIVSYTCCYFKLNIASLFYGILICCYYDTNTVGVCSTSSFFFSGLDVELLNVASCVVVSYLFNTLSP